MFYTKRNKNFYHAHLKFRKKEFFDMFENNRPSFGFRSAEQFKDLNEEEFLKLKQEKMREYQREYKRNIRQSKRRHMRHDEENAERITLVVPKEIKALLNKITEKEEKSLNQFFRELIQQYLKNSDIDYNEKYSGNKKKENFHDKK